MNYSVAPRKTLHSAWFFFLLMATSLIWELLCIVFCVVFVFFLNMLPGNSLKMEANMGKLFFLVALFCCVSFLPIVALWIWAGHRVRFRVRRIMAGRGWGGWFYIPSARESVLSEQRILLNTRRMRLFWQIPLIILLAAAWGCLADWIGWGDSKGKMMLFFLGSMGGCVAILILPSFFLFFRAYPRVKKEIAAYEGETDDFAYHEQKQTDVSVSLGHEDGMASDYASMAEQAHLTPKQKMEEERRKNLRRNLWWQFLFLVPLAVLWIVLGFEGTLIVPFQILLRYDVVEISVVSPLMFFMGAVLIPVWLYKWWVHASVAAQPDFKERVKEGALLSLDVWKLLILGMFIVLLPLQFLLMPFLGYYQCNKLQFKGSGSAIHLPLPVKWVKHEKAKAGWCVKK